MPVKGNKIVRGRFNAGTLRIAAVKSTPVERNSKIMLDCFYIEA